MRKNETTDPHIEPGNMVQVFINNGQEKRGKWLSPRLISAVDTQAETVSVPGSNGLKIVAALGDTRLAITEDDLASQIVECIDRLDDGIADALEIYSGASTNTLHNQQLLSADDADFSGIKFGAN